MVRVVEDGPIGPGAGSGARGGTTDRRRPIRDATVRLDLGGDAAEQSAATNADGVVEFRFEGSVTADVVVDAARRARERRAAIPVGAGTRITLTVAMRPAATVGGVVEGASSAPVAGVRIRAFRRAPWIDAIPYEDDPPPLAEVRSDAHGEWRIDSLPLDEPAVVVFSAEGFADAVAEVPPLPDADVWVRRDVRMPRGTVHRGSVVDPRGNPAPGRMVYAVPGSRAEIDWWLPPHLRERLTHEESAELWALMGLSEAATGGRTTMRIQRARAGADGSFEIHGILADAHVVAVAFPRRDGAPIPERRGAAAGLVPASARASLRMREPTIARISVPGAAADENVTVAPAFPWERWRAASVTGPGAVQHVALDGRVMHFFIDPDAHAPWRMFTHPAEEDEPGGGGMTLAIRLRNGRVITGKVVDDRGEPIAGAHVAGGGRTTTTRADGTYRLRHAQAPIPGEPNWDVRVEASMPGHVSSSKLAEDDEAVFNLQRAARLRLKISLPEGAEPPPWHRVWIGRRYVRSRFSRQGTPLAPEDFQSGPVERAGRWFQSRTWTGELDLRTGPEDDLLVFVAPGFHVATVTVGSRPGEETDLRTLFLSPAVEVQGTVVTEEGSPVAGAEVSTWGGFRPPWADALVMRATRTDGQGRFRLPLLTPYDRPPLLVTAPGFPRIVTESAWDPEHEPAGGGTGPTSPGPWFVTLHRGTLHQGRVKDVTPRSRLAVRFGAGTASVFAEVGPDGLFSALAPEAVRTAVLVDAMSGAEFERRGVSAEDRKVEFAAQE